MKLVVIISFLGIFMNVSLAHAYPEMIRIGYQNCAACHASPTGGGVMTPYGRGMSSDILSTWAIEGEEAIGDGLIKGKDGKAWQTPDWLQIGGDSRWIQTYVNNLQATQTQWFPMENEFETAVKLMKLWIVGNLDFQGGPPGTPNYGNLIFERLYGMYNITDAIYLRAGKYMLPFGINQPNHTAVIAQGLGWDEGMESDNVETGFIGEKYNVILTGDLGRPDNSLVQSEKGIALNFAYNLLTTHKIGWSAFSGNSGFTNSTRFVTGPYFILGFFRKLVLLSQLDLQWKDFQGAQAGPEQQGFVTFNRLQYEVLKGVSPYIVEQISYLNNSDITTRFDSLGAGVIWFPRPHFEFWAEWEKLRNMAMAPVYTDSAWLVLHYYL